MGMFVSKKRVRSSSEWYTTRAHISSGTSAMRNLNQPSRTWTRPTIWEWVNSTDRVLLWRLVYHIQGKIATLLSSVYHWQMTRQLDKTAVLRSPAHYG